MDYEKLKEVIAKKIKENGRREITGPVLQAVLMAMVDSLGEVYPQTYTEEQKAQARANIDALSDYDGEITKEKLSLEVQAILNDVANKQNITDESLATIAKTIVGAINELFNGGVKDKSIEVGKLAQAVQDTLGMVGTNVKVLPASTDLLSSNLEEGIWIVDCSKMKNAPSGFARYEIALLIINSDRVVMMGTEASEDGYPIIARRGLKGNEWGTHTMISVKFYSFLSAVQEALATKLDNTAGAVGANNIADGAVSLDKLAFSVQNTLGKVGTNIKVLPAGTDLLSDNIEEGVYILLPTGSGTYPNFPYSMNLHPGATAILAKAGDSSIILGVDTSSSDELPLLLKRRNGGNWYGTSIYNKINSKLDASSGAVKTANLANGAVSSDKIADGAVISTKLSDFLQDKVKMVGMNVKVLPDGTDLLSEDLEEGIYVVDCSKMTNVPSSITKSDYDYALSLLIVDREHKKVMLFGLDNNSTKYPTGAYRHLTQKSWNNTPKSIFSELSSLKLSVIDKQNKQDATLATTSKEVVGAINELFNGGVKDKSIEIGKLAQAVQDTLGKVGMNVKVLPEGTDLLSKQEVKETGLYLTISNGTYKNFPPLAAHNSPVLLIVTNNGLHRYAFGQNNFWLTFNFSYGGPWRGNNIEQSIENKVDKTSTLTDTEVNNIWDNN